MSYKGKSMFNAEENINILISSIKDKVEKWEKFADGSIVIKPKKANFDELCISFRKIFMDTEYTFIISKIVVKIPKTKYLILSGKIGKFSLELKWKREFFIRKPIFVKSSDFSRPENINTILNLLNSEKILLEKIKKCNPENLMANLIPLSPSNGSRSIHLSWIISMNKLFYRNLNYSREMRAIFDMLDHLSKILSENCVQLIKGL
jgi:hypothetical protein